MHVKYRHVVLVVILLLLLLILIGSVDSHSKDPHRHLTHVQTTAMTMKTSPLVLML